MSDINIENIMNEIRANIVPDAEQFDVVQIQNDSMSVYHRNILGRLENSNEVVIFGVGRYGKMIMKALKAGGIEGIKCFCDNNPNIVGLNIEGLPIVRPEEALKRYPDAVFVITAINYPIEITAQLLKMGVDVDKIRFYNFARSGL